MKKKNDTFLTKIRENIIKVIGLLGEDEIGDKNFTAGCIESALGSFAGSLRGLTSSGNKALKQKSDFFGKNSFLGNFAPS